MNINTVRHKENIDSILIFVSPLETVQGSFERKCIKKLFDDEVDNVLYLCIFQKLSSGQPVYGQLLCETPFFVNKKLYGENGFQDSFGWIRIFK